MGSKKHQRNGKALLPLRTRTTRSKGRPLADPEHNTQLLTEQLRSLGLYAAHTLGDGNCLFRALSDQLYGTPSNHLQLRRDICDWIETHSQRYEPFCEDERGLSAHLQCMNEQGTYGGHLELSAFAHFVRRNVKVIQPGLVYVIEWNTAGDVITEQSISTATHGDEQLMDTRERRRLWKQQQQREEALQEEAAGETIYVAYHNWEHFSSIRNLRGPHAGLPNVRELPTESESVVTSPVKKKPPSSRAKSKPESKADLQRSKNGQFVRTKVKIEEAAPPTPTQVPLPMSRSPSPLSSSESQIDVDTSHVPVTLQPTNANDSSLSPTLRIHRSPKRTFDESSGSSSFSDAIAKRTRSSHKLPPSRTHINPDPDAIEIDNPEEQEPLPELSSPGCSVGSTRSSSAASSPLSTPPPEPELEPVPVERALTRRQRKALGLPKTRAALAAKRASAGKIIIPGGRFKRGTGATMGEKDGAKIREAGDGGADDEGSVQEEEWQRNGTGRLDVRGFRELKI
ncbi:cysteine proteinase [Gyrodon lividus]|nr:cysteine proteinase [Gyrodon lividus]